MIKKFLTVPLVSLILFTTSCKDAPLLTIAKVEADVAQSNLTLTQLVISADSQGLISKPTTNAILNVLYQVAAADQQASAVTRNINSLTPDQQKNLRAILAPVIVAVQNSINSGLIGITDTNVRNQVQIGLTAILTLLTSAQAALPAN